MMDRVSWTQFLVPGGYIFLVGVIAIFAHSGLQGDHGLAAYHDANQEAARIAAELEALQAERVAMASQVNRLSEKFLDMDLLDERARDVLGLVRPDEIVAR